MATSISRPRSGEAGVVVGEELAKREELGQLRQPLGNVAGEGAVIVARIEALVAYQPAVWSSRLATVTSAAAVSSISLSSGM